jgi:glycerol-3-phosphate dehydrogenase
VPRPALLARADNGPPSVSPETCRRWALTYGDRIDALFARIEAEPAASQEIAPGVPRAELEYVVEAEDAMTAEDFLLRRTKLHLLLDETGRDAVARWFAKV